MLITTTTENMHTRDYAGITIPGSASENMEDGFTRQAFHAIRLAIAASQSIDIASITPDSTLETFFPRRNRKQRIRAFQQELGVEIDLLVVKSPLEWGILMSTAISLIALFLSWKAMVAGMAFTAAFGSLAVVFGRELELVTIKQLAERIAHEHYRKPSSGTGTVAKIEMNRLPRELSLADFQL